MHLYLKCKTELFYREYHFPEETRQAEGCKSPAHPVFRTVLQ